MLTMQESQIGIRSDHTGNIMVVDEQSSIADMQQNCWQFFKTPHGKRETYSVYRGQLIVRNTVQYTGCRPSRHTVVYLYVVKSSDSKKPDLFCISSGNNVSNIRGAKRLIDRLLNTKAGISVPTFVVFGGEKRYAYRLDGQE